MDLDSQQLLCQNYAVFPEGRGLKPWTSDDSKALIKVYLLRATRVFIDFCYIV